MVYYDEIVPMSLDDYRKMSQRLIPGGLMDKYDEIAKQLHDDYFGSTALTCNGRCELVKRVASALREAVREERERCAKIVDSMGHDFIADTIRGES
jgi:hypothetical protein